MNSVSFLISIEDFNITIFNPKNGISTKSVGVFKGLKQMSENKKFLKQLTTNGFTLTTNLGVGFWETDMADGRFEHPIFRL